MKPNGRPWRPDLFVLVRFLNRLYSADGQPPIHLSKSRLQTAVGVNYDIFRRYLQLLTDKALIVVQQEEHQSTVRLTDEGRRTYERLSTWLRDLLGSTQL